MSYTAKPPFATGMQNNVPPGQSQQQQSQSAQGVPPSSATGSTGQRDVPTPMQIPLQNIQAAATGQNPKVGNNASSSAATYLANASTVNMSPMNRQQLQQQQQQYLQQTFLLQQQHQQHQQQYFQQLHQQQQQQQGQQQQQQVTGEPLALSRMVNDLQKSAQQSNGNLNQSLPTTQQLQQLVQLQSQPAAAIINMLQQAQAAHQQKPFQQPLPANTTITPVSRQNILPSTNQSKPVNYPQSKAAQQTKQQSQQSAVLAQVRRNAHITPKPPAIISNATNPLIATASQASLKVTGNVLPLKLPTAVGITANKPSAINKPAAVASTLANVLISKAANNTVGLKKVSDSVSTTLPLTVKTSPTPSSQGANILNTANKQTVSPKSTILATAASPTKLLAIPVAPQKLSPSVRAPVSPRTKQTPRKNSNPIKTTPPSSTSVANNAVSSPVSTITSSAALAPTISPSNAIVSSSTILTIAPASTPVTAITVSNIAKTSTVSTASIVTTPVKVSAVVSPSKDKTSTVNVKPTATASITSTPKKTPESNPKSKSDSVVVQPKATTKQIENEPNANKAKKSLPEKSPSTPKVDVRENTKIVITPAPVPSNSAKIDQKIKRIRLKTIPYQSPIPEIELISKLTAIEANNSSKNVEDKLILFYKHEFLAVRNAEGSFFLCQTMQNVYKSSPRIRIRWLSEEKQDLNIYALDFYDHTDIECVLTTVSLEKHLKGKYELTKAERERVENILKKALDVEKGVLPRPDVTEENPDGLDLSLYKNESQIEKRSPKRKAGEPKTVNKTPTERINRRKKSVYDDDDDDDDNYEPQKRTKTGSNRKKVASKKSITKTPLATPRGRAATAIKENSLKPEKVNTTPSIKKTAPKRKLIEQVDSSENDQKDVKQGKLKDEKSTTDQSACDETQAKTAAKVAKPSEKSPKVTTSPVSDASTSGRTTRRTRV